MTTLTRCLIIDDEPLAIQVIQDYLSKVSDFEVVATCKDAMEAHTYITSHEIDLLFLDIEMPHLNGIEFIKSLSNPPDVILTTAYREYAVESYDIDVIDYLVKPISFQRFFKAVTKYRDKNNSNQSPSTLETPASRGSIYVYADKKNVKVHYHDILYIESIKDYVRICTTAGNLISKSTLTHYEESLPSQFVRTHRSYIINKNMVSAFTTNSIEIQDKQIPISGGYRSAVLEELKK